MSASLSRGLARAVWSRRSIASWIWIVSGAASDFAMSGKRFSMRVWTSSPSTTWTLIRLASGSMTAGSSMTVLTSAVKRSVLKATWWVQMATVVSRIDRQARISAMPARIRRLRRGFTGTGSVAVVAAAVISSTSQGAP